MAELCSPDCMRRTMNLSSQRENMAGPLHSSTLSRYPTFPGPLLRPAVVEGPPTLSILSCQREVIHKAYINSALLYVQLAYNLAVASKANLLSRWRSATDEGHLQAHIGGGHRQGRREGARAAQAPGTQAAPGARLRAPAGIRTRRAETSGLGPPSVSRPAQNNWEENPCEGCAVYDSVEQCRQVRGARQACRNVQR